MVGVPSPLKRPGSSEKNLGHILPLLNVLILVRGIYVRLTFRFPFSAVSYFDMGFVVTSFAFPMVSSALILRNLGIIDFPLPLKRSSS
jgi:hypothetical protein